MSGAECAVTGCTPGVPCPVRKPRKPKAIGPPKRRKKRVKRVWVPGKKKVKRVVVKRRRKGRKL